MSGTTDSGEMLRQLTESYGGVRMLKESYLKPEIKIEVIEPHAIGGFLSGVPGNNCTTTTTITVVTGPV